ncbi:putative amidase [Aquitalea magnusonii]|uniref:Putative amidase n=1 Tax=Aquitalea magnusonii TaxID=332411 RepID=A0A3G9GTB8_9NEIS|nr:amidase [Aquitalea magnusonii]BBF88082.1 putative amidase [Aquitalea magnusonii]
MLARSAVLHPIVALGALELSQAIHQRDYSCVEVMRAYLDHIEQLNPSVNALVSLQPAEVLLEQAARCDKELAQGQSRGWLHGMPQAIKDLSATQGIPTTMGSMLYRDQTTDHDGIMVQRMRQAGAIVIGKSNTPEFGAGSHTYNAVFGATGNAYAPQLSAGGSSGGAAVALALRMLPVADGSDMMGSLRNPAAFNNVFGFRPSWGAVPLGPAPELFLQQLATEGPMGRNVPDILALLKTQAGPDLRAPLASGLSGMDQALERDFHGCRIAWLGDWNGYLPMEDGIMAQCEQAWQDFRSLGCQLESSCVGFDPALLWESWEVHRHWLMAGSLYADYQDPVRRSQLKPELQWEVEGGLQLSALDVYRASRIRSDWYRAVLRMFDDFDFLLLPSAQVYPFALEQTWPRMIAGRAMSSYHRWMEVVIGPTMAGLPVMNVPAGFGSNGLPMGLQLIGRPRADSAVLQLAHAYDQQRRWVQTIVPDLLPTAAR